MDEQTQTEAIAAETSDAVTEPAVTESDSTPSEVPAETQVSAPEETTFFTSLVFSEDELLISVKNIEQIQLYEFGILLVTIAVVLSIVIIKTFFGKEL